MSDLSTFTPESLAAHDGVVESNLRIHLAKRIEGIVERDDLLGALLRLDTSMAEGARMALEIAVEVILDESERGIVTG